jgi:glycosyltransferase involved in cell wall biosynthesis
MHHAFNEEQYDKSLTSKILLILSEYFNLKYVLFKKRGVEISKNINFTELPYKHSNPFNKLLNIIYAYKHSILKIKQTKADLIWISATASLSLSFLFIYKILFPQSKFYIQLYTPSVNANKLKRFFLNGILALNLKFFNFIFVGNVGNNRLQKKLKIPERKAIKTGLGIPDFGFTKKDFSNLKLIYVGTLHQRDVWKTIYGLKMFLQKNPSLEKKTTYDIIGSGKSKDIDRVKEVIIATKLTNIVRLHGFLPTNEVKTHVNNANIGVNFLPLLGFYNNTSTKTLEYLIAGLPVISTKNDFCLNIFGEKHGVFCEDNANSFADALSEIYLKRNTYNPEEIRKHFLKYSMEEVIKTQFVPILHEIIIK